MKRFTVFDFFFFFFFFFHYGVVMDFSRVVNGTFCFVFFFLIFISFGFLGDKFLIVWGGNNGDLCNLYLVGVVCV